MDRKNLIFLETQELYFQPDPRELNIIRITEIYGDVNKFEEDCRGFNVDISNKDGAYIVKTAAMGDFC